MWERRSYVLRVSWLAVLFVLAAVFAAGCANQMDSARRTDGVQGQGRDGDDGLIEMVNRSLSVGETCGSICRPGAVQVLTASCRRWLTTG